MDLEIAYPNDGPPSSSVEQNKDACKHNHGVTCAFGRYACLLVGIKPHEAYASENQEAGKHAKSANDERSAAAEILYYVDAEKGAGEIYTTEDHGGDKGVLETDCLEDLGAICVWLSEMMPMRKCQESKRQSILFNLQ